MSNSDYLNRISPKIAGRIYSIPNPRLSPEERKQRRLSFRNERNLYRRTCSLSGKNILSVYSPDKPYQVYESPAWWGDGWDGASLGREVDFSRPFFEQFAEVLLKAPLEALFIQQSENCDYINYAGLNQNCYLVFNTTSCQDCLYARGIVRCSSSSDLYYCTDCEICYECVNCSRSYNLNFCRHCSGCSDSNFLANCRACTNCTLCTNLSQQEFCFLNQKLSPEKYKARVDGILSSRAEQQKAMLLFNQLLEQVPQSALHNFNCEKCSGDYLTSSARCENCFEVTECEDCTYCDSIRLGKDLHDCFGFGRESELLYETLATGSSHSVAFAFNCSYLRDSYYCGYCTAGSNLFGCVGLKHKEYCVLNQQYSAEEYYALVPKLINHMRKNQEWGEFFSPQLSPFGYNESVAQDYYPLNRSEAEGLGFKWSDYRASTASLDNIIYADKLPDAINDCELSMAGKVLMCPVTNKHFALTRKEIEFYKSQQIAVPIYHPDERHRRRVRLSGVRTLRKVNCAQCGKETDTSEHPESQQQLLCEECFTELFK